MKKLFTIGMRLSLNKRDRSRGVSSKKFRPPPGGTPRGGGLNHHAVSLQVRPQRLKRRFSDLLNNNLNELPNHHANNKRNDSNVSHEQSVRPVFFSFSLHNRFYVKAK